MAKTVIALEITEESVRAAEITTGRTPTLVAAGEVPLPPGAAHDSEVLDADAVAVAIRQLWGRTGIKGRRVVLGIGSRRVLVREYSTPVMKPEHLRQALPFQVQDLLPVPPDQAVLDFCAVSESDGQLHGLLVAAVAETVEGVLAALAKGRLRADAVDLVPLALARVARRISAPEETLAMVHIGDHTSYVVVAEGGKPRFVRIIPLDLPTEAVRARAEIADPEAAPEPVAELVVAGGATHTPAHGLRLRKEGRAATIDPAAAEFVRRVRSTILFYADRPGALPVTGVVVSGAGAAIPGMYEALVSAVAAPVRPITASEVVAEGGPSSLSGDLALNLVSTIGLALGDVL